MLYASRGAACAALRAASRTFSFTMPTPKLLGDVVKLELLQKESSQRVAEIWRAHHDTTSRAVGAVLHAHEWARMAELAKRCPFFVLPVAKGDAKGDAKYVTFVAQQQGAHTLYTLLDEFRERGPDASVHLVLTSYDTLLESHNVALSRGELVSTELSLEEAKELVQHTHDFYSEPRLTSLVEDFNRGSESFSFEAVLAHCGIMPVT